MGLISSIISNKSYILKSFSLNIVFYVTYFWLRPPTLHVYLDMLEMLNKGTIQKSLLREGGGGDF